MIPLNLSGIRSSGPSNNAVPVGASVFEAPIAYHAPTRPHKLPPLSPYVAPLIEPRSEANHKERLTFDKCRTRRRQACPTLQQSRFPKPPSAPPFLVSFRPIALAGTASAGLECCRAVCTIRDDDNGKARGMWRWCRGELMPSIDRWEESAIYADRRLEDRGNGSADLNGVL
jgi:hypothetical protein